MGDCRDGSKPWEDVTKLDTRQFPELNAVYFGVLPVLAETTASFGGDPAEIGRAAILGQMTTGFPLSPLTASTFILVGMAQVELGKHQRYIFLWALATTLIMTAVALATGALSL
jgi:CitMHS family citrate-Mg2+:H+ or citrate-Ca2+:H+ symporter